MITKDEALNTIAVKHGHKDWELARYRLGDRHLHVLILEAMEYYASQSNSHKQVVSGKRPLSPECQSTIDGECHLPVNSCQQCYQAASASGALDKTVCKDCGGLQYVKDEVHGYKLCKCYEKRA